MSHVPILRVFHVQWIPKYFQFDVYLIIGTSTHSTRERWPQWWTAYIFQSISSRKKSIASSELSCLINWYVLFSWLGPSSVIMSVHSASTAIKHTCPAPNYFARCGKTKWDVTDDQLKRLHSLTKINRGIRSAEQFLERILYNVKITRHFAWHGRSSSSLREKFAVQIRRAGKSAEWRISWAAEGDWFRRTRNQTSCRCFQIQFWQFEESYRPPRSRIFFYRSYAHYLLSYRKHVGRATTRASRRLLRKPQTSFFNYEPSRRM